MKADDDMMRGIIIEKEEDVNIFKVGASLAGQRNYESYK